MTTGSKRLSSTVLEMKFMQRTKRKWEAKEKKKKEAEMKKECFGDDEDPGTSDNKKRQFEFCTDLTSLERLKFGRMSFKGFNPEVEKLMIYYERRMNGEPSDSDSDDGKDIGDREMAQTYATNKKPDPSAGLNESATGEKLNFSGFCKRGAQPSWADDPTPPKSSRKD